MILFNKAGKEKIYHLHDCKYLTRIKEENLGYLDGHNQARALGYRCCKRCDSVARLVRREEDKIAEFCQKHELTCLQEPGALVVNAHQSQWRIVPRDAYMQICLYHRNWIRGMETSGTLKDYHPQKVKGHTIMDFLEYIIDHDEFRKEQREAKRRAQDREKKKQDNLRIYSYQLSKVKKGKKKESFTAAQLYNVLKIK